ncbi:threonine/homoserine/homoserine lactone efflux protein [Corynebacterium guangdongense]|uniref:Threonine/homoserine/homoserine lactone efflux protein n=1 Tax=Corynebacterium guangdongense TaxID=1783348 RepID=A0ABU1ZZ75_9CORY|nr:threonine/homoserine/homoserine lactone efflux protein [Corynebacterium guangdongense]
MVLSFWALALLLSATPGPDWALVLGHSLGGRSIVPPLTGIALGYLGLTTVVAAGLGAVVASQPAVLTIVTILGALVLAWIGVGMLRSAVAGPDGGLTPPAEEPGQTSPTAGGGVALLERATTGRRTRTRGQIIAQGATVSGLNPKGLLLFVALLPQFVSPAAPLPVWAQMFTLGLVFIVSALSVYTALGLTARRLLAGSERASRILTGVAGGAMILVAAVMLAEHFLG